MSRPTWINADAWKIVQLAKALALSEGAGEILVRHLFQACCILNSTLALVQQLLVAAGLDAAQVQGYLQRVRPDSPPNIFYEHAHQHRMPLSLQAQRVLEEAGKLAVEHPAEIEGQVVPEHLLAAICFALEDFKAWLLDRGWSEHWLAELPEKAKTQLPKKKHFHYALRESDLQLLREFCRRDLTDLAHRGRLTPAYGMEDVLEQLVRCLLRKGKRCVVLTGPAGVGKTKLVEDLALRIAKGELPDLEGCHVFELDLALFTRSAPAGSGLRAEKWARFTEVLQANSERIIIFVDELHTLVGLPLEGRAMDLANALKPLIADGGVRIIGATTPDEYRQYIEGDPALARRFTEVRVPEPDEETMLVILRKVAPEYEEYHGIKYSVESLEEIFKVCKHYLPNQHFPAKAIELLDEVGVGVRRRRGEGDLVARPEDVREALRRRWGIEPEYIAPDLAEFIKTKVIGQDHAADRLAEIVLTSAFMYRKEERRGPRAVILFLGPPGVGKSYMAKVLAELVFPGRDCLLTLDMAEFSGKSPHAAEHARFRLLGPPPPYVGWETGGILTQHVLQHPLSVVLIDEFEKASPEARNVLLQIFAEGQAQDGRGRLISFKNIYFILTANAGRKLWEKIHKIGFQPSSETEKDMTPSWPPEDELRAVLLEEGFMPELLSRISHIVLFNNLTREHLKEIARLKLAELRDSALMEDLVLLEYDEEALAEWLVQQCGKEGDCRRLAAVFEAKIEALLARWRMQKPFQASGAIKILRLKPGGTSVELVVEERTENGVKRRLLERVAEVYRRRERYEKSRNATRALLGTVG